MRLVLTLLLSLLVACGADDEGTDPATGGSGGAAVTPPADRDSDGIADADDLCPDVADPAQADVDGDGRGDACDPACGDTAAYAGCTWDLDEAGCATQGGEWGVWGFGPDAFCKCPSGDGGCPCKLERDCASLCVVRENPEMSPCEPATPETTGTCSPTKTKVGCFCLLRDDGEVWLTCYD